MKKIVSTALLATSMLFAADAAVVQKAKQSMMELGKTLKGELKQKFKEDPSGLKAVEYCANQAQKLTKEVNARLDSDVKVRRTALKYRSEHNEPSIQDINVMDDFQHRIENLNQSPKKMMKVVETKEKYFVYKALGVGKPCLKCHGDVNKIDSRILNVLNENYPYDRARNFKLGEFRGAIVAEIEK